MIKNALRQAEIIGKKKEKRKINIKKNTKRALFKKRIIYLKAMT